MLDWDCTQFIQLTNLNILGITLRLIFQLSVEALILYSQFTLQGSFQFSFTRTDLLGKTIHNPIAKPVGIQIPTLSFPMFHSFLPSYYAVSLRISLHWATCRQGFSLCISLLYQHARTQHSQCHVTAHTTL